jgi:hypothetical protein
MGKKEWGKYLMKIVYISEEILKSEDLYDLCDMASSGIPIHYRMTEEEIGWFNFIRGKYSITDYIRRNTSDNFVLTIDDIEEMSKYLDYDCKGWGKAVMLSDETALQRIFFWLYQEEE